MNHKIPKIIHQIWVGDDPIPEHCGRYVTKMKEMHPDWNVKLWGNEVFELYGEDKYLNHYMRAESPGDVWKWATFFAGMKRYQEVFTLIDCTVYGSAPDSRAIGLALSTYDNLNHCNGCKLFCEKLIEEMGPDIALFGYRYFYNDNPDDEKCIVLHDVDGRLLSWVKPEER